MEYPDFEDYWRECVEALRRCERSGRLDRRVAAAVAHGIESALAGVPPHDWAKGLNSAYNDRLDWPDQAYALIFIRAAELKIVTEAKPAALVAREFDIDRKTLTRWRKQFAWWMKQAEAVWFAPDNLDSVRGGERKHGAFRKAMLSAAARYRGQNHDAECPRDKITA